MSFNQHYDSGAENEWEDDDESSIKDVADSNGSFGSSTGANNEAEEQSLESNSGERSSRPSLPAQFESLTLGNADDLPNGTTKLTPAMTREGSQFYDEIQAATDNWKRRFEIEFPPEGWFEPDENIWELGPLRIRKSALLKAYLFAYRIYSTREGISDNSLSIWYEFSNYCEPKKGTDSGVEIILSDMIALTSTILLFAPENPRATNTRKRAFLEQIRQSLGGNRVRENDLVKYDNELIIAGANFEQKLIKDFVDMDMLLLDNLLTSPLRKYSASSNLWSHRRWLMQLRLNQGFASTNDLLLGELRGLVTKSAEKHPRNYHAWSYMRWLLSLGSTAPFEPTKPGRIGSIMSDEICITMIEEMVNWCVEHPDDISGWSFLRFLACPIPVGGAPFFVSKVTRQVFEYTLNLATMRKWRNESVWMFLRTVASWKYLGEALRSDFFMTIKTTVKDENNKKDDDFRHLLAAANWCREYGPVSSFVE